MSKEATYELSADGIIMIDAVDRFLEDTIRDGHPIEALIATRRLGEIARERTEEAARAATEGAWSWSDVGNALGMTRQAAHEKLRSRVQEKLAQGLSKLDEAEQKGHAKIARRAKRGRERLDEIPQVFPKVEVARERIADWERRQHDKLDRKTRKARSEIARAERSALGRIDQKASRD
jgi:hypothetical protein